MTPFCGIRSRIPLGRDPIPSCKQVGPKVSDCNDRNGLSRKCGNISPLKRNGYFERFPHQRWRTNGERRSSVLCGLANPHNGSTTVRFDSDHSITVEESPDALALLAAVEGTICQPSPKGLPSHAIAPNHLQQSKRLGHRNVRNCHKPLAGLLDALALGLRKRPPNFSMMEIIRKRIVPHQQSERPR